MKPETRETYTTRVLRVIDYIYAHLDEDLRVEVLAEVATLSPFHFHRIYRELARETLNATIRRLRLQRAAELLLRTDLTVSDIAGKTGYRSAEALTRAFSASFGTAPAAYRTHKKNLQQVEAPFVAMLPTEPEEYIAMYEITLETLEPVQLAGLKHTGDYFQIGQAFEKMYVLAGKHQLMNASCHGYGIYYDDPKSVPTDSLRSLACINVDCDPADIPDVFESVKIPAGRFASLRHQGPYTELEKAYDWMFGQWLPQSGLEVADFPPVEEYLNDPKTTPPSELLTMIRVALPD